MTIMTGFIGIPLLILFATIIIPQPQQQPKVVFYCDAFQITTRDAFSNTVSLSVVSSASRIRLHSSGYQRILDGSVQSTIIRTTANRKQRISSTVTYLQQQSTTSTMDANGSIKINGSSSTWNKNINMSPSSSSPKIPFIIERIPNNPSSELYKEIAQMCITAFFNTDNNSNPSQQQQQQRPIPIWKEWQLAYLRTLQAGDLERRRKREPMKNRMFLARQVVPLTTTQLQPPKLQKQPPRKRPLVLDTSLIRNLDNQLEDVDYMYGDIIGFVEVTQRPYGLGEEGYMVERYVLTNLSVDSLARQSGVGTALVNVCEQTIYSEYCRDYSKNNNGSNNSHNNNGLKVMNNYSDDPTKKSTNLVVVSEIVLEVEDDNYNAINFYRKRNYMDVCIDPTSRRYDLSGLWLQQIRCKRLVMKKDLRKSTNGVTGNSIVTNMENTMSMGLQALQRFRDNLLNVQ